CMASCGCRCVRPKPIRLLRSRWAGPDRSVGPVTYGELDMNPYRLADFIDDRPEAGVFRVARSLFNDPAIFDLEMQHVFEGGWVFLGMASQAEKANDFFTTTIGRVPVLVTRDRQGVL